ncbi:MmpS family transport accessory protein [Rhodococcus ruber]|uniref:MmpS family membrane protein n=1 Tax=Rhodococcus ruber TaxID=1830 RepID=A0A098BRE3_9NOCA|nr:MmpS family transport accessory protein [Rhodococcus ruber]MCD2125717.1 hypothetical protein [Rhodococcus ruber]MCZ4501718.1 MmpS family transport accessory protein [Rhodococcus ruber]MCZ4529229.1 MmpS family transport accessory protein [Rhodococcus ruber]MCZ4618820.1 MmpS family transport accessory protein [Rhodococcus ruber]MDI9971409.1 MmpS family transport accessory protein [Rhodococcus ruber]
MSDQPYSSSPGQQPPPGGYQQGNYSQGPYPQGQYPPGYYQQPPRKKKWPWIVGGIVLFFLLVMGGCMAFVGGVANEIDKEANREVTVTYQVEGTGTGASVTYSGRDMNMAQETDVTLPWTKDVTIDGLGKFVSLTVTNNEDGGSITCRILADDAVVSEQTSSGPFASANCTGDAGQN